MYYRTLFLGFTVLLLVHTQFVEGVLSYPKWDHNEYRPQLASPFRFFSSRVESLVADYCEKPAQCLNASDSDIYCFNQRLPYSSISLDLIPTNESISIQSRFQIFQNLQNFPKCWNVIQPYICAIYMPRCENNSMVLPSLEMCKVARIPCQFVYNSTDLLPRNLFNCDEQFEPKCHNDLLDARFNNTAVCQKPLVPTDQTEHFYQNIDGCGLQCQNPLYTVDEHEQIHHLIVWGSIICLICHIFTVVTFIIDWENANKYPALLVFYINLCSMISCVGWLLQFYGPDSRTDIVCRKDGTLRISEPSARENLTCVIDFFLVYFFSMASVVWFVILTYAWHMNFLAQGKVHEKINKQRAYFHLMAWSIPVILTISTMAFGEIDGDYITGICFVGHISVYARISFLIIPIFFAFAVSGYFLIRGLSTLIDLQSRSRDLISSKANRKIKWTIFRVVLFTVLTCVYGIITLAFNIYMLANRSYWNDNLSDFIMCKLTHHPSDWNGQCVLKERPSFLMLYLQILAYFAANVTSSSWVWTGATLRAWKRCIRTKFVYEDEEEPTKLQKHKVIAKAYGKRKGTEQNGRISISLQQSHTDPVAMNFDLNSVATLDNVSRTWAENLHKLVKRRDALTVAPRSSSVESEISISRTRVSYESGDSQLSVEIHKQTHKFHHKDLKRPRRHKVKKKRKKCPTSQVNEHVEKQAMLLQQVEDFMKQQPVRKVIKPNMKRRAAIYDINDGLANGIFF